MLRAIVNEENIDNFFFLLTSLDTITLVTAADELSHQTASGNTRALKDSILAVYMRRGLKPVDSYKKHLSLLKKWVDEWSARHASKLLS